MKNIALIIVILFYMVGCSLKAPGKTPDVPVCVMPAGYSLTEAIDVADTALTKCPDRMEDIFMALVDVAQHKPDIDNKSLFMNLFKRHAAKGHISERYAKSVIKQYFSTSYESIPAIKVNMVTTEMDSIKRDLKHELSLKKIGLVECCNDITSYEKAEKEYARILNFIDNIVLNEAYVKNNS